jgi:hypothetical protein
LSRSFYDGGAFFAAGVTLVTSGAGRGPQYPPIFSRSVPEAVLAPTTARSQLEGNVMDDHQTFEETYPKYEFSELVRVGITVSAWIVRMFRRAIAHRPDALPTPAAEDELHAH